MPMTYRGLTLDPFQEKAIQHLQADRSVLVCAPTGTGKTVVADWIVEDALSHGQRVIYTAPVKALSNQKYRDWCKEHGEDSVGLVTGDLVINRDAPCLVMTTEILRNMLLSEGTPDNLRAVVLDEIHFLDDRERGTVWEEVLIYLPQPVQIVGLSATLSNLDAFAAWLEEVRQREVGVVVETRRAVPLEILLASTDTGICTPKEYDHRFRRKGGGSQRSRGRDRRGRNDGRRRRTEVRTRHHHLHKMMRKLDLLPYLYFVFSRRDTERFARQLAERMDVDLLEMDERERLEARLKEARRELGTTLDRDLIGMYRQGVAFHHAGLHVRLKTLVEELYEARLIKVLYCTSTFALGINLPARAVCFDQTEMYDGTAVNPLTVRQFMQAAGRAGRRGLDEHGSVVVRVELDDWSWMKPLLERYEKAPPEPVRSSFNLSWNSVVRLLERHDEAAIRELLGKSFLSWHLDDKGGIQEKRLAELDGKDDLDAAEKRERKRLVRNQRRDGSRVWDEFANKVGYLAHIGYLDDDHAFAAGASIVKHLQISEILTAELVLEGVLEGLEGPTLFGLMCAISSELPRAAEWGPPITRDDRRLLHQVRQIRFSDRVEGSLELTRQEQPFGPEMLPIGRMWAEGRQLDEILGQIRSATDMSGDLVTTFRRAKDLVSQLATVYQEDKARFDQLRGLMKRVSRDEVEVVG